METKIKHLNSTLSGLLASLTKHLQLVDYIFIFIFFIILEYYTSNRVDNSYACLSYSYGCNGVLIGHS